MRNTTSGAWLWFGTFTGVYMLVVGLFLIFSAASSQEPEHPPSTGKKTCPPYQHAYRSTTSCLA